MRSEGRSLYMFGIQMHRKGLLSTGHSALNMHTLYSDLPTDLICTPILNQIKLKMKLLILAFYAVVKLHNCNALMEHLLFI